MDKLKCLRLRDRSSYKAMADMLGISKTYYWQLENDKRRMSYEMAVKIASLFHTTPDELFLQETLENHFDENEKKNASMC